jgi:hypothetical protein
MKKRESMGLVRFFICILTMGALGVLVNPTHGMVPHSMTTIEIYPGDSFELAVESLTPGDTLIVHEGTYTETGYLTITVLGTLNEPVVIKGAEGESAPHITRILPDQNAINIDGATHLTIKGLEISNGAHGIKMTGNPTYITLEELIIHDVEQGISLSSLGSDMHHIRILRNHIYHTVGSGEGLYIGCNAADCVVSDSIFEGNWIHDTLGGSQGEGIELKEGSHSNIVRDNVISDTSYPCILLYGTLGQPQNLVEGNVVWNCGIAGIQVAADAVIQNNIILNSPGAGLKSAPHQSSTPQNLQIVHNSIVSAADKCVRLYDWANKPNMVFANNAVYCDATMAVYPLDLEGVVLSGNVVYPASPDIGITGRSTVLDFIDAANKNVYPSSDSPLIDAGDPVYSTEIDFNGNFRVGTPEAGAYTWTGPANPGWGILEGFKQLIQHLFLPLIVK